MNRLLCLVCPSPHLPQRHCLAPLTTLTSLRRFFTPSPSRLAISNIRALHAESAASESMWEALPSSVYVHIPFCRRRCFYCDFPIVAVGERTEENKAHMDSGMVDYVELVCREIRLAARVHDSKPLKTVFFGGGTPSLLPPALLLRIVETLREHFGMEAGAEVSMEMDPGTFDAHSLRQLTDGGLSRVSMGVQSFQAALLKSCGRAHGLREVYEAVEAIHATGLRNWSLDLISSLPHQTLADWEHSLNEAVKAAPAHISVYDLQIEEGTLFNKWYKPGQSPLPSDDNAAEFYRMASRKLQEAGFAHYEISNYAREGFECKHNLVYWHGLPYFAFGLGSTSYVSGQRFSRPRKFKQYREFVESFERSGGRIECALDSKEERALDTVMLSLRLARGLDLQAFADTFGAGLAAVVSEALLPFVSSGHVVFMDADLQMLDTKEALSRSKAFVRLTDPNGFLLSNEVIASIFSALPSGERSQYRACAMKFFLKPLHLLHSEVSASVDIYEFHILLTWLPNVGFFEQNIREITAHEFPLENEEATLLSRESHELVW